jgi:preprotein translocase subunit SecE
MLGVRVPPGLPTILTVATIPPRRLLREAAQYSRQNGRNKMAKASTVEGATSDKPVKTGKPGKAVPASKPGFFEGIGTYFRDVRAEMNRVVWPNRAEVLNSSVVVVTTLVFFIVFITLIDYVVVIPLINFIARIQIGG